MAVFSRSLSRRWKSLGTKIIGGFFVLSLIFGGSALARPNIAFAGCNNGVWDGVGDLCKTPSTTPAATAAPAGNTGAAPAPAAAQDATGTGTDEKFYDSILIAISYVAESIAGTVTNFLVYLIGILISIINYDGFSNSQVINIGWPLVRDAINMFVVLALLAIAVKNLIPGSTNNQKTISQLITVFVAVVAMNFSRTITLLAVDFSQVVTITFAQAVSDIAAGNFIQLFALQNNLVVSGSAGAVHVGGPAAGVFLGTIMLKMVFLGAALIAIGAMIAAFLVRILLLWFLIIVAPAAFFVMGLQGTFSGKISSISKQWMDQFTGMLLFGPVLMFFLWLSLAISSGGDLAANFNAPKMDTGFILESASSASMLGTIVGIAMLFIGIMVAAQVASSTAGIGGIMKSAKGYTQSYLTKAAKVTGGAMAIGATGGAAAAVAVGAGVAAGYGYKKYDPAGFASLQKKGSGYVEAVGARMEATGIPVLGSVAGRKISELGIAGRKSADKVIKAEQQQEADYFDSRGSSIKHDMAIAGDPLALRRLTQDKDFEKSLRKERGDVVADAAVKAAIEKGSAPDAFDYITDDAKKKKAKEDFFKFQAANLHMVDASKRDAILRNDDFRLNMLSEDAITDAGVRDALKGVVERRPDGKGGFNDVTMLQDIEAGRNGTQKLRKIADQGFVKTDDKGNIVRGKLEDGELVGRALTSGKVNIESIDPSAIASAAAGKQVVDALVDGKSKFDPSKATQEMRDEVSKAISANSSGRTDKEIAKLQKLQIEITGGLKPLLDSSNPATPNVFINPESKTAFESHIGASLANLRLIGENNLTEDIGASGDDENQVSRAVSEFVVNNYVTGAGDVGNDLAVLYEKQSPDDYSATVEATRRAIEQAAKFNPGDAAIMDKLREIERQVHLSDISAARKTVRSVAGNISGSTIGKFAFGEESAGGGGTLEATRAAGEWVGSTRPGSAAFGVASDVKNAAQNVAANASNSVRNSSPVRGVSNAANKIKDVGRGYIEKAKEKVQGEFKPRI